MTTNARDEKWSEWIDWSGGATPVSGDDIVQWKGRNEFHEESSPVQAGMLCWRHTDSPMDIIAYRYKIKEPESVSMSEDLRWLAKNCDDMMGAKYISREDDGYSLTSNPYNHNGSFSYDQWVTARKALEHEAPEVTPEEDEAWQAKERSLYGEIKEGFDALEASRSDGSTASYYELPPGCTELQDLISYRNLNAQDGEIFRAIYRKGRASHSDALRDARKVLFYAKAEVERLERYCIG